ncbi:uncharacterized, partial [Tachysurus ichikawai]
MSQAINKAVPLQGPSSTDWLLHTMTMMLVS